MERFKESGKFVVAYGEVYSQGGYYLASVADSIYLNPVAERANPAVLSKCVVCIMSSLSPIAKDTAVTLLGL